MTEVEIDRELAQIAPEILPLFEEYLKPMAAYCLGLKLHHREAVTQCLRQCAPDDPAIEAWREEIVRLEQLIPFLSVLAGDMRLRDVLSAYASVGMFTSLKHMFENRAIALCYRPNQEFAVANLTVQAGIEKDAELRWNDVALRECSPDMRRAAYEAAYRAAHLPVPS